MMISRKAGLMMIGSALLLAACHKTTEQNATSADMNVSDTSNMADNSAAMSDSTGNDSNAMMSDDSDNGERSNTDTRGGGH